jgi:hypothetical protein
MNMEGREAINLENKNHFINSYFEYFEDKDDRFRIEDFISEKATDLE